MLRARILTKNDGSVADLINLAYFRIFAPQFALPRPATPLPDEIMIVKKITSEIAGNNTHVTY